MNNNSGSRPLRRNSLALLLMSTSLIMLQACGRSTSPQNVRGNASALLQPQYANGIAARPPMGWNGFNTYKDCNKVDENVIRTMADRLQALNNTPSLLGYKYEYLNLDDCWSFTGERTSTSAAITHDSGVFPNGMASLASYIHSRGLKAGIYSSPRSRTCGLRLGSQDHETADALQFKQWGFDYLKYDRCHVYDNDPAALPEAFQKMGNALKALQTGPTPYNIVYSINPDLQNGQSWSYFANLWRTTKDIKACWENCAAKSDLGIMNSLDGNAELADAAGLGGPNLDKLRGWNDPDMLEVGVVEPGLPSLSDDEYKAHFSLWAMMSAPLILGNNLDPAYMTANVKNIITNGEVIAIDQDDAGIPGVRVRRSGGIEVWSKPLKQTGARAVLLFNRSSNPTPISFDWSEVGLAWGSATVRDLWAHSDRGAFKNSYTTPMSVPVHGVVMLKVVGTESYTGYGKYVGTDSFGRYEAEASVNTGNRNATPANIITADCEMCTGGKVVRYLGNPSIRRAGVSGYTLNFNKVYVRQGGKYQLRISYATGYDDRYAAVTVNGITGPTLHYPSTGSGFEPSTKTLLINLNSGMNTVSISNPNTDRNSPRWSPNIDSITIIPATYEAENRRNDIDGGARMICFNSISSCPQGAKVSMVGTGRYRNVDYDGKLTFNNIDVPSTGNYQITIFYASGAAGRQAQMSVNGGAPTTLTFPSTGSFETVGAFNTSVNLNGGKDSTGADIKNTIRFSCACWAPDFDKLTINSLP